MTDLSPDWSELAPRGTGSLRRARGWKGLSSERLSRGGGVRSMDLEKWKVEMGLLLEQGTACGKALCVKASLEQES